MFPNKNLIFDFFGFCFFAYILSRRYDKITSKKVYNGQGAVMSRLADGPRSKDGTPLLRGSALGQGTGFCAVRIS